MKETLSILVERINETATRWPHVIPWACPVPAFGDPAKAKVATLGLNPSNREFVDQYGNELENSDRRFHTLGSLGIARWSEAQNAHLDAIVDSCRTYFSRNPYSWFERLDQLIRSANASYFAVQFPACHLDLVPYATECKWRKLSGAERLLLLEIGRDALVRLLRSSSIRVLVLNGRSVVTHFQAVTGIALEEDPMPNWALRRRAAPEVRGVSYTGVAENIAGVPLANSLLVLGFNHNIQSTFGVTNEVITCIGEWVSAQVGRRMH